MKRVVFVTKSKLSQNLLGLIIQSLDRKIEFTTFDHLESLEKATLPKAIHLVLLDHNCYHAGSSLTGLESKQVLSAKKVFIHTRSAEFDKNKLEQAGFDQTVTKPFLTEEIVNIIESQLDGKK